MMRYLMSYQVHLLLTQVIQILFQSFRKNKTTIFPAIFIIINWKELQTAIK